MSRTTKSPLAMARAALATAEQVVPPYSCKHSRKDFTQPQLLALLLLKQFFQIGYRDVVAWVAEWSDLREALGLTKVPHFTAIQKAGARLLKKESLESLLDATIALARERGLISDASELAAIDSTGLETRHVSTYYGQRSGRKYHRFPKLSAVVDVHSHLCLAAVIDRGPKPDDAEFRPAVRQARRRHHFRGLLGDAGYDSERNHRYLDRYCSVLGIIPPRRGRPHRHRHRLPGGFYRRFWAEYWPAHWYGQRWQVETHFSMHKRLLGSALRARRRRAQDQEIFLRVLALNLMIACWAFWRFLQSMCGYKIDPYVGCANLVISKNWCHSKRYAEHVYAELKKEADKGSSPEEIKKVLTRLAAWHLTCGGESEFEMVNDTTDELTAD